jgi:hypothetical protein
MSQELKNSVEKYIESQCDCKVVSSKPEQVISDLGFEVTVWNVKTDRAGSWWVATSDTLPMHFYPQDQAYFFSTDEVFSFHIGLMLRLMNDETNAAKGIIDEIAFGTEININIRRKLQLAAEKLLQAVEIEEIQAIGVVCRETLLALTEYIFRPEYVNLGEEAPKKSDFKNKCRISLDSLLVGSDRTELRDSMRKLSYSAWDYCNWITHTTSSSVQDAAIALNLCTTVVSALENLQDKANDPLAGLKCKKCGSKKLFIAENDEDSGLLIVCEKCNYGYSKHEQG